MDGKQDIYDGWVDMSFDIHLCTLGHGSLICAFHWHDFVTSLLLLRIFWIWVSGRGEGYGSASIACL